jgi:hypothetical protein
MYSFNGSQNRLILLRSHIIIAKYSVETMSIYLTKRKHKMFILFKKFFDLLNRFSNHQTDLERFIIAHNPVHGGDVDNLIRQFTHGHRNAL